LNVPGQKDKFTPELRILVASLLSILVILVWGKYYGPKPPVQPLSRRDFEQRCRGQELAAQEV
jgi:hypothetical protein